MTDDEIRNKMVDLERLLGTWHNQINQIASRETQAAIAQHPLPYGNPELTKVKDRLVAQSEKLIDQLQQLHRSLISPRSGA